MIHICMCMYIYYTLHIYIIDIYYIYTYNFIYIYHTLLSLYNPCYKYQVKPYLHGSLQSFV